jgi:hypothetical protein
MREMDEVLAYIQHCRFSNGEGMVVFRNCGRIVLGVGKYPPDTDALPCELAIQTCDFRHVAVGDRAIAGRKDENHDTYPRSAEFLDSRALKVQSVGLVGM